MSTWAVAREVHQLDALLRASKEQACFTISMAQCLEPGVVAEAVETPEQLEFLRAYGCDEIQGYLLSRPISGSNVIERLQQRAWHDTPARTEAE